VRRHDWRDALAATRDEWEAAYEGEPTPFSATASMLLEGLHGSETLDSGAGMLPPLVVA